MFDFLIIGAQKSGSTYIHKCIEMHPDVYMPSAEIRAFESPFFEKDGMKEMQNIVNQATTNGGKIIGIKRPDYLCKPEVPGRLAKYCPNARLIVILRNPISRALSSYYHLMKLGFLPIERAAVGIQKIMQGVYDRDFPKSKEVLVYGKYHEALTSYFRYFKPEQILVMLDEDVRSSKIACVQQVYKHIGVDVGFKPEVAQGKSNIGVYSLNRLKFINLRNRIVFDHQPTYMTRKAGMIPNIANAVIIGIDRLLLSRLCDNTPEKLSDEDKHELFEYYRADMYNLNELLNGRVSHWLEQN